MLSPPHTNSPGNRPVLRYPVFLIHGLGGFDVIRLELLKKHPLRIEYFKAIPALLESAGVPRVAVAALPPHGSIRQRAQTLKAFIDQTLPDGRFHLIAHSMGGLDSRDYLTGLGGAERAVSLTTLGTPHRGSPIANLALKAFIDPCGRLLGKMNVPRPLKLLQEQTAAHRDLRPEACAEFNARTPDAPGVAYFSWGGAPPPSAIHWLLRVTHEILSRTGPDGGNNDGLVTLASARWSGWRGSVPADHIGLVGWQLMEAARKHFRPEDLYLKVVEDLRAVEQHTPLF